MLKNEFPLGRPVTPALRPKILVGICSCRAYADKRQAVRNTWLSKVPADIRCKFFIGGPVNLENEPDTIVLPVGDGYNELPLKVLAFFQYCLASSDFDWLFKCDDDTYLALDRLHDLVPDCEAIVGDHLLGRRGSPSGGAGYLLSRAMVEKIVHDPSLSAQGPEDVIIGEAAIRHGASAVVTHRLCWDTSRHPGRNNDNVTCHWVSPLRMIIIHTLLHEAPQIEFDAIHKAWRDRLLFFDNGYFGRLSTRCCGKWIQQGDIMHLEWLDWEPEELFQNKQGFANDQMIMIPVTTPKERRPKTRTPSAPSVVQFYKSAMVVAWEETEASPDTLKRVGEVCQDTRLITGPDLQPDEILWREVRGMSAGHNHSFKDLSYVPQALKKRLAYLRALKIGAQLIEDDEERHLGFLVFESGVQIEDTEALADIIHSQPIGSEFLWVAIGRPGVQLPGPEKGALRELADHREYGGFWISYGFAKELIPRLESADCEWETFIQFELKIRRPRPALSMPQSAHKGAPIVPARTNGPL